MQGLREMGREKQRGNREVACHGSKSPSLETWGWVSALAAWPSAWGPLGTQLLTGWRWGVTQENLHGPINSDCSQVWYTQELGVPQTH